MTFLGVKFMEELGANSLNDLREKSTEEILKSTYWHISPSIEGLIIPKDPLNYYLTNHLQLPTDGALLLGSTSLDTSAVFPFYNGSLPSTIEEYKNLLQNFFGE